jgi:hypothetical protein
VPKGADPVRVCLRAGKPRVELDTFIDSAIAWAAAVAREERVGQDRERYYIQENARAMDAGGGAFLQSKLYSGCGLLRLLACIIWKYAIELPAHYLFHLCDTLDDILS